jgi:hypothetical protein
VFAVPNGKLASGSSVRLLRVSYYAPWKRIDIGRPPLDGGNSALLLAARITGIAMPVASLIFLLGSFYQAVD